MGKILPLIARVVLLIAVLLVDATAPAEQAAAGPANTEPARAGLLTEPAGPVEAGSSSQAPGRPAGAPRDENSGTRSETGPSGELFSNQVVNLQVEPNADRPFILPFAEPPGPDTWLLGQTYGNTVGAYFNRNTTYRFSGGIHFGIDLSAPCGTEIVAIADGVVALVDATAYGSLPHNLIIDHPQLGYSTLYGHLLERPNLTPGQEVKQGEVVALSGDPEETCFGRPHLHLEVRDYPGRGWKYNPINLIDADWDNLALVGSFRSGFERDLDDPRKWQHLDDQPPAVTGGPILNNFANPWPRTR